MRNKVLPVFAGALVLGLVTAATAVSQPNAGTNDYSSGFGFLDDEQTRGSVGYELIGLVPGGAGTSPAQGEFDFRRATREGRGIGFHADGFCINADGEEAVIGVQVEQSTDPDYRSGEFVEALAIDNGDGMGDEFDLDEESSSSPVDCMEDGNEDPSPIRGNIVVQDGGFAGGVQ